ncbi:flagellar biosynthesis protein FlaG [Pseudodesulfovibrio cashew]|uniref:Flagellar biosynthesis protein FlaG n=1 Tax=Pseudodesulfovibrio cashew TaxID=2678688 RepID=A0A6I6JER2_9BACT|nr:flagellar protein FlaG [Pseudodesulfovibrio cashew]QGY41315.1 flagellar biosynthesis protein FlaG [Pseudodesulfovibrio cashew]
MNIPEINNDVKQSLRSESVAAAQAVHGPSIRDGSDKVPSDAVQKQDSSKSDKQSQQFSKEQMNDLVKETQELLENNDVKLKFNVLEENDTVQVEIIDGEGKVIRKIPGDDLLKLSKSLKNLDRGFLDEVS